MGINKNLSDPAFNSTGWNVPLNANFDNIDSAFGGVQAFNLASVSGTVAVSGGVYAGAYPANTASYVPLIWSTTGVPTGAVTLQLPSGVGGQWLINNACTGSFAALKVSSAGGGTTILVAAGAIVAFISDGTNVYISPGIPVIGFRNRIINGMPRIDQRNSGSAQTFTAGAALAYCVDRFYGYCTGANVTGQLVVSTGSATSPSLSAYRFTGAASVTAISFAQRISANDSFDLAGRTATLSVNLANSLLASVTWHAYYANTSDTFGTVASPSVTSIASGTFTVNSTLTNYSTSFFVPSAATTGIQIVFSVGAQTSGTWTIGNVQLEPGTVATPFENRLIETEVNLCKSYFQVVAANSLAFAQFALGSAQTAAAVNAVLPFQLMRVVPTVTSSAANTFQYVCASAQFVGSAIGFTPSANLMTIGLTVSGASPGQAGVIRDAGAGTAFIRMDAEL